MRVDAWSRLSDAEMAPLYAAEAHRWRAHLHWDYDDTRRQLEQVREQGRVPGLVARDAVGRPCGWTFFVRLGRELQIGALTAATRDASSALLAGVLTSPAANAASRTLFFGFADAPGADAEFRAAGFVVGQYRYLTRSLAATDAERAPHPGQRGWQDADLADAARLLREAYAAPDPLRPFGGAGEPGEWLSYTHRLIATTGCGVFLPALSVVRPGSPSVDGLALVTRISPDTVHLAQVAVRAASRGRGVGADLVRGVLGAAAAAGFARMTLLVSDANTAALRLYERLGFEPGATFLSASRGKPE